MSISILVPKINFTPDLGVVTEQTMHKFLVGVLIFKIMCPQRNNLCNLLAIGISIGDLDCENQDVQ